MSEALSGAVIRLLECLSARSNSRQLDGQTVRESSIGFCAASKAGRSGPGPSDEHFSQIRCLFPLSVVQYFHGFPAHLSLHHYFVVAARMQHHFESNLVAV